MDLDFVAGWSRALKAMNDDKEGGRYCYPESFVKLLAVVHAYVLPYRQLEGFMRGLINMLMDSKRQITPPFGGEFPE